MKQQKNYLNELKAIQEMAGRIRTISEACVFNEEEFDDYGQGEEMMDPEQDQMPQDDEMAQGNPEAQEQGMDMKQMPKQDPEKQGMEELDQMGEIDKIRAITLQGMQKFASKPTDPQYQALSKILSLVDKSANDEIKQEKAQMQ